jgi:Lon protease-like protein
MSSPSAAAEDLDNFECSICVELLYEPYTGPCGHSFCRRCAGEARRRDPRCPTCRASWRDAPANLPISSTLATAIRRIAPAEYAARAAEAQPFKPITERTLGVFQLYHVLPQQRLQLHVFESRYRQLVARALQREPRTFAMAGPGAQVFCEVEIVTSEQSRDGRYYIEVVATRRLRAARDWVDNSGLRVAVVSELIDDAILPQHGFSLLASAAALTAASMALIRETRQKTGRLDAGTMEVLGAEPPSEAEALGLWAALLLLELPPLQAARDIRLHVLRETDSLRRMHIVQAVIHACLDELDAEATVSLRVSRIVRVARALLDYRELGPFTLVAAGGACLACQKWSQMIMVVAALYVVLAISAIGVGAHRARVTYPADGI